MKKRWVGLVAIGLISQTLFAAQTPENMSESKVLSHIAMTLDQVSTQLVEMQGQNQQNWDNYFKLSADMRYSAQSYPSWQSLQKDFGVLGAQLGSWDSDSAFDQANQAWFNPELTPYASTVDKATIGAAMNALNQLTQQSSLVKAAGDAVSVPLKTNWQQALSESDQTQLIRTLSVQMATNNALVYQLVEQSQAQQTLMARLLVEVTAMNQNLVKFSQEFVKAKAVAD